MQPPMIGRAPDCIVNYIAVICTGTDPADQGASIVRGVGVYREKSAVGHSALCIARMKLL